MPNIKITSREWRFEGDTTLQRLFCYLEDGSVYSCSVKFDNWLKEEPSNAELETSLLSHLNKA